MDRSISVAKPPANSSGIPHAPPSRNREVSTEPTLALGISVLLFAPSLCTRYLIPGRGCIGRTGGTGVGSEGSTVELTFSNSAHR